MEKTTSLYLHLDKTVKDVCIAPWSFHVVVFVSCVGLQADRVDPFQLTRFPRFKQYHYSSLKLLLKFRLAMKLSAGMNITPSVSFAFLVVKVRKKEMNIELLINQLICNSQKDVTFSRGSRLSSLISSA